MRYLIVLIVCCLPAVVEADDFDFTLPRPYETPQVGFKILTCNTDGTNCRTPCEEKMREAMKLILPYIDYGDTVTTVDALYRSQQTKLREEADRLDRRDAALRKWNKIYEECAK